MNREFPISTGSKISYFIVALVTLVLGLFLWIALISRSPGFSVFGIFLVGLSIFIVIATLKRKIVVYDDRIIHANIFRTRELPIADIKGCRVGQKVINIIPNTPSYSKITINNYIDFSGSGDLAKWLRENFTDLNEIDYQADLHSIQNDTRLGITDADRKNTINKARKTAIIYNVIGAVFIILLFVFKKSPLFDAVLLVYPFIAVVIILTSKGLIKLFAKPHTPYYTLWMGTFGAIIPMFIKSAADYSILELNHLWLPCIIAALALGIFIQFSDPNNSATSIGSSLIFVSLIIGCLYGFSFVILTNCDFDHSPEKVFQATILDHNITQGKGRHFHILISPWGPQSNTANVDVSETEYYQDTVGSTVNVYLKKGLLNIPWYTVSK